MGEVTGLPRVGERWFKNRGIEGNEWKSFLKNLGMDITIFKRVFQAQLSKVNGGIYC